MTPVRLKPVASRSRVKHSTTEPLRYLHICIETLFGVRKLDFDDLDLITKVTAALCNFKVGPKLCLCMLSLEIIGEFQPVLL